MTTFGYTTLELLLANDIYQTVWGSVFNGVAGECTKLTAGLRSTRGLGTEYKVKLGIYKHLDLSWVANTNEYYGNLPITPVLKDFTFASNPTLQAIPYILVAFGWTSYSITDHPMLMYHHHDADQGHSQGGLAYPTFPNPYVPGHNDNEHSIYATVTPSVSGCGVHAPSTFSLSLLAAAWLQHQRRKRKRAISLG